MLYYVNKYLIIILLERIETIYNGDNQWKNKTKKIKLTVEEQIQDMKSKNIQFELYSNEEAKKFSKYNNYYFLIKSYAKNYNINPQNKNIII